MAHPQNLLFRAPYVVEKLTTNSYELGAAMSVSDIIGCRYLTVDSKTDSIDFYKKVHFKIVEKYKKTETQKMYIDMYPIVTAMRPKETLEEFEN